ncbi:hypothetical protein FRC07_011019, partial [Ceratobasidium sp. 392]
RDKKQLLQILLEDDQYWVDELYKIAIENEEEKRRSKRTKWRKRGVQVRATQRTAAEEERSSGGFFHLPPDADTLQSYAEVHAATTNAALEHRICAVCARRRLTAEAGSTRMRVIDIPNRHRLIPQTPHPAHILTQGCLLELKACHGNESNPLTQSTDLCNECLDQLRVRLYCHTAIDSRMDNSIFRGPRIRRPSTHLPTTYGLERFLGRLRILHSLNSCWLHNTFQEYF